LYRADDRPRDAFADLEQLDTFGELGDDLAQPDAICSQPSGFGGQSAFLSRD
jgi:hypothetical protein